MRVFVLPGFRIWYQAGDAVKHNFVCINALREFKKFGWCMVGMDMVDLDHPSRLNLFGNSGKSFKFGPWSGLTVFLVPH